MNLNNIFVPKSIAIIGASEQINSVGRGLSENSINNKSVTTYLVNPKYSHILGQKSYGNVLEIPESVDLAIIAIPARFVIEILEDIITKGIKSIIVISAGFSEVGPEGLALQNKLLTKCIENDITMIGPNCLGVINCNSQLNLSFSGTVPSSGNVALVSQSGAICTAIIDKSAELGIGFSKIVSVGNKAMVGESQLIDYLATDSETNVIAIYSEGLRGGVEFIESCRNCPKPIIIIKSGTSNAGSLASSSHTGALASEDILYETLFRQAGIIRAGDMEEFFEYIRILGKYTYRNEKVKTKGEKLSLEHTNDDKSAGDGPVLPMPTLEDNNSIIAKQKLRIAIVTNAGGPGVLATDAVEKYGMELANFDTKIQEELRKFLPPTASVHNPVDLIGDAPMMRYKDALHALGSYDKIDAILVILTPQTTTEIEATANVIVEFSKVYSKPVVTSFVGFDKVSSGIEILARGGVLQFDYPEQAVRAFGALASIKNCELRINNIGLDSKIKIVGTGLVRPLSTKQNPPKIKHFESFSQEGDAKQKAQVIFGQYESAGQKYIPEVDAKKIFEYYGIPTVKSVFCRNVEEVSEMVKVSEKLKVKNEKIDFENMGLRADVVNINPPKSKILTPLERGGFGSDKLILKIISQDVFHKTDVGGVRMNVELEDCEKEFAAMMDLVAKNLPDAKLEGILFSEMVDLTTGVEFILGAKKDSQLGTAVMFGLGGTMVELINDVVFGFGELDRDEIMEMINCLDSKKIIEGYRGKNPLDLEAIITTIQGLSNLLRDFPNITEVDMNPVLVGYNASGVKVLDAKIVVG
jgi:acetate---CoA ligase (ADP-forming)